MADGKQQADTPLAAKIAKQYGRVVISLENVLLPPERLNPTPSSLDGLDEETETDLRILGCELIQTAGILLKLPQVAVERVANCHVSLISRLFLGCHGDWAGPVPQILLQQVIREAADGGNGNGVPLLCFQSGGSTPAHQGRHICL